MTSSGEDYYLQVNTIQLLHLNDINMRFYGAEYNNTEVHNTEVHNCIYVRYIHVVLK